MANRRVYNNKQVGNFGNITNTNLFSPIVLNKIVNNDSSDNGLNQCQCRGTLSHISVNGHMINASICPNCDSEGGLVSLSSPDFNFVSNEIFPSRCFTTPEGTFLHVTGYGQLTTPNGEDFVAFHLLLFESNIGSDRYVLTIIDSSNGVSVSVFSDVVPDNALVISNCTSNQSRVNSNTTINSILNSLYKKDSSGSISKTIKFLDGGIIEEDL
ncbi:hypothetical protein MOF52_05805 [Bacillus inaquosorum]|uniref:hypothetical protein n=1 Tax=Bacillus inaquosorum TaxID=483913 RepID=UPI002282FC49|nr:hypothetical protein [Bacillus inaquosorum]MCY9407557.1 hypothetical protein [Bacillus inaquosorum]MCY9418713.1 hypothetical protein [Bacillus inaquosorum]